MSEVEEVTLNIIHFNDVYNAVSHSVGGIGGAARFLTALEKYEAGKPSRLVLFSGDAYSPSALSGLTRGHHMQKLLNLMHVDVAVLGNHELDFGLSNLADRMDESVFPWLNSNITYLVSDGRMPQNPKSHIIEHAGLRIGFIGLLGSDWVDTLPRVRPKDLDVHDPSAVGAKLASELKNPLKEGEIKCDLVIALTHMHWSGDRDLANTAPDVDIILGGHNHEYNIDWLGDAANSTRAIIKSGTDFMNFSFIEATVLKTPEGARITRLKVEKVDVNAAFAPDVGIEEYLENLENEVAPKRNVVIGEFGKQLDSRSALVRTTETAIANFTVDVYHNAMQAMGAELAIVNTGNIRWDRVIRKGLITHSNLESGWLTYDRLIVLSVSGKTLMKILEMGVSMHADVAGRFPMISGLHFAFDPAKDVGCRVISSSVLVQDQLIDLKRDYRVCTRVYLHNGKDGYTDFPDCPVLVPEEQGVSLYTALIDHFRRMWVCSAFYLPIKRKRLLNAEGVQTSEEIMHHSPVQITRARARWLRIQRALENPFNRSPQLDGRIRIVQGT